MNHSWTFMDIHVKKTPVISFMSCFLSLTVGRVEWYLCGGMKNDFNILYQSRTTCFTVISN